MARTEEGPRQTKTQKLTSVEMDNLFYHPPQPRPRYLAIYLLLGTEP